MDNKELLEIGLKFRGGGFPNETWETLNKKYGKPFLNGESFRSFVKRELKKQNKLPSREERQSEELIKAKIELDFKKQQCRDEITYLNKIKRPISRTEMMLETIRECTSPLPTQKPFQIIKPKQNRRILVALHSDGQVGEMVKLQDTAGLNQYNLDIYNQRQEKYLNEILNACDELGIDEVYVPFLGDAVEGNGSIYKRQKFYLESHVVKQIFDVSESNAWFLKGLKAGGIKNIYSQAVIGNHGNDGYDNHAQANFDTLAYDRTKLLLENENDIQFEYSDTFMEVINVLGFHFLMIHGDGMNKKTIENAFYKYSYMYANKGIQLYGLICGHFHVPLTLDVITTAGSIIINGNIVGSNHLSVQKLQSDNKASQTFFVVEDGVGITYQRKCVLN